MCANYDTPSWYTFHNTQYTFHNKPSTTAKEPHGSFAVVLDGFLIHYQCSIV